MTASFVLQEFTAGAVRSSAYGRWRAVENDGPYRVQAGTVVVVTEGPKPVGYFHVEEVRQRNCRSKPCILATDVRAARRAGKEGKREMPGWATVDERRSRLYIQSWSAMIRGRVSNDWVRAVSADVTDADLGQLVRKALAESKTNVPVPNFRAMDPSTDPLLVAAGVKTYVGYARAARQVNVDLDDRTPGFRLVPTLNSAREGWVPLHEYTLTLDQQASDDQLGAGVRAVLDLAIGWPGRMPPSPT